MAQDSWFMRISYYFTENVNKPQKLLQIPNMFFQDSDFEIKISAMLRDGTPAFFGAHILYIFILPPNRGGWAGVGLGRLLVVDSLNGA